MSWRIIIAASLGGLGACASPPGMDGATWPVPAPSACPFDFGWRLSGDQAVAPMQVFDDGREIWLHFAPEARLPAILGVDEEGERPLPHTRRAPYVVLPGVWPELRFQGGGLRATALRNQEPGGSVREGLHCRQPSI